MSGVAFLSWIPSDLEAFVARSALPTLSSRRRTSFTARSGFRCIATTRMASDDIESIDSDANDTFPTTASSLLAFQGAGVPRVELQPEEIPPLLMKALELNDFPYIDAGLESMWAFAGDTTRHIFQQNVTDFIESAHETADQFPTSFYGCAMYGKWSMETEMNRVGGEHGWIATQVMKTITSDGRLRRWQWELRKNKRPPDLNVWFVESIGSSDRKGQFEPE